MVRKLTTLAVLSLATLMSTVHSWKYQGHLLVARMAYDILNKQNPTALKKAEVILSAMANQTLTDSEKNYPFVEAAPFADMIKYRGGQWQSNWHFVDIPYFDQGGNINNYPDFKEDMMNITVAITGIVDWLMDKPGYESSPAYQTIMENNNNDDKRGRSYALRLLIHYLGDIHQPLHSLSRVNPQYPAGDRGGNDFPLPNHLSIKELHAAWDSVLYEFPVNDKLPYDEAGWNKLGESVAKLVANNPVDPNVYSTYDVKAWSVDSWKEGTANAYKDATINQALSSEYVKRNNEVTEKQLVIAAHRLAKTIEMIFNPNTSNDAAQLDGAEEVAKGNFLQ